MALENIGLNLGFLRLVVFKLGTGKKKKPVYETDGRTDEQDLYCGRAERLHCHGFWA